jgi:hypothetical protein
MGISNLSLQKNATGGTTTGGTAMALSSDGTDVKNGKHVVDASETNFVVRSSLTLKTRNPQRLSDGSLTKAKRSGTVIVPKVLADGSVVYNLVRCEHEIHPETTPAEHTNILMLGAQFFTDSDLASFHLTGNLD